MKVPITFSELKTTVDQIEAKLSIGLKEKRTEFLKTQIQDSDKDDK